LNNIENENSSMPEQKNLSSLTEELFPDEKSRSEADINLNGSWERKNRSITAAAFAGLLGIGVLYFNVQSILISVFFVMYQAIFRINISGDLLERLDKIMIEFKTPVLIALVISQYLFMLLPSVWIVKKWHTTEVKKYLRIKWIPFKEIILSVLITITLLPFCYYISYLLLDWLDIPDVIQNLGNQLFTAHSTSEFILLVFIVAVTPAICEEVFFRGYVQRTMERNMGAKSFVITGIIFGLFHMQPLSLISLSILGVLFSFFFYRSKSILPSGAAHFTNNFIALLLLYIYSQSPDSEIFLEGNIPLEWVLVSSVISITLLLLYLRITREIES
jgi:hypothetical protein